MKIFKETFFYITLFTVPAAFAYGIGKLVVKEPDATELVLNRLYRLKCDRRRSTLMQTALQAQTEASCKFSFKMAKMESRLSLMRNSCDIGHSARVRALCFEIVIHRPRVVDMSCLTCLNLFVVVKIGFPVAPVFHAPIP